MSRSIYLRNLLRWWTCRQAAGVVLFRRKSLLLRAIPVGTFPALRGSSTRCSSSSSRVNKRCVVGDVAAANLVQDPRKRTWPILPPNSFHDPAPSIVNFVLAIRESQPPQFSTVDTAQQLKCTRFSTASRTVALVDVIRPEMRGFRGSAGSEIYCSSRRAPPYSLGCLWRAVGMTAILP